MNDIIDEIHKFNVGEFIEIWRDELEEMIRILPVFADNLDKTKEQPFVEWVKTWVAWNELATEYDIENYYKR